MRRRFPRGLRRVQTGGMPAPSSPPAELPLLEWLTPSERGDQYRLLIVRPGDAMPDSYEERIRTEWWSGWKAQVEWYEPIGAGPGEWEWHVWQPLLRGTGLCLENGTAPTAQQAQAQAALALLKAIPNLTDTERWALRRQAGIRVVDGGRGASG